MDCPATIAQEWAESFLNGNRKYVRDELWALAESDPKRAVAVAFYLRDQLQDDYSRSVLGRLLSDSLEVRDSKTGA